MRICPSCRAQLSDLAVRCASCQCDLSGPARGEAVPAPPAPPARAAKSDSVDRLIRELLQPWQPPPPPAPVVQDGDLFEPPPTTSRLPEQVSADLTEFTLQFVRAVTKSSYYTAEHREADRAKLGLYACFTKLVADRPEVTFFSHSRGEKRSMLVYGIFDEPTDLEQVMLRGMAQIYIPKLSHYFDHHSLLSISFKRALSEQEFLGFVDLLADPTSTARGGAGGTARELAERGIQNISVVAREDRIGGRRLSWRVEMALSRLKKDLSVIPLYRHLSEDQRRQVRLQVFRDVLRPLRQVNLIRELLENCDLVGDEVNEFSRDQVAEIEAQVLHCVKPQSLPALLEGLAQDLVEARRSGGDRSDRLLRMTRRVATRLDRDQARKLENAFRDLLVNGVMAFEELPVFIQEKLKIERDADTFLEVSQEVLERFGEVTIPLEYQRYLDFFARTLPELVTRSDLSAGLRILETVGAHQVSPGPFGERAQLARTWSDEASRAVAGELVAQLRSADRVRRGGLLELARALGEGTVPTLLAALGESDNASARHDLEDLLAELKTPTRRFVIHELEGRDLPVQYLGDLLRILARTGSPRDAGRVAGFLGHTDPAVRAGALEAACELDDGSAEHWALQALGDVDPKLRELALKQLFSRRSTAPALFSFCNRLLAQVDEDSQGTARWICGQLAAYDRGAGRERSVALLRRVLEDSAQAGRGWWSSLRGSASGRPSPVSVQIEACRALAHLRATEALSVLSRLACDGPRPLQQAASHALRRIEAA